MLLNHAWIAAHIPHSGGMCLLDRVLSWDAEQVVCAAGNHRDAENPLRLEGCLGICAGIEYAAQAMAVHGVLNAGDGRALGVGYLASVRGVRTHASRLDDQPGELAVRARRISGDDTLIAYRFDVGAAGCILLEGRATVLLDAGAAA